MVQKEKSLPIEHYFCKKAKTITGVVGEESGISILTIGNCLKVEIRVHQMGQYDSQYSINVQLWNLNCIYIIYNKVLREDIS